MAASNGLESLMETLRLRAAQDSATTSLVQLSKCLKGSLRVLASAESRVIDLKAAVDEVPY